MREVVEFQVRDGKEVFVVCKTFFENLFEVSSRRILSIARSISKGENVFDKRGGDRRSRGMENKLTKVKNFIGKFKGQESHYNRSKSRRLYLHSSLTIRKMWKIYIKEVETEFQVNYGYFHKVFSTHFNLGFGSPATDVCSYCERLKYASKKNPNDKDLQTNLKVHKVRAKQFNMLMNEEEPNAVTFCFDLQQVQNLPKLPIQEAFYSLQIAFYCFCVTDVKTKSPHFYVWTENIGGRGSNEISSALLHFLRNADFETSITKIRLFCDGCGGQNKNSHLLHALMLWLNNESPKNITDIVITYPVRGHSYLPADRVFGRIEKELRRHDRILLPNDYINIYKEFGAVHELGKDWTIYNVKALRDVLKKYDGISEQKIVTIQKISRKNNTEVVINSQVSYRNVDESKKPLTLIKRGKSLKHAALTENVQKPKLSTDKGRAVNNLLIAAFGKDWRLDENLNWYFEILQGDLDNGVPTTEEEALCRCVQEEGELQI